MSSKKRPGVMLYFDIRPSLRRLSDAEKGRLFEAMLDYGEKGLIPDFDGALGVAWDFIQPRLDADGLKYQQLAQTRAKAANTRWNNAEKSDHANAFFAVHDDANDANAFFAMQTMPTTTSTTTSTSTTKRECKRENAADKPPPPTRKRFIPPTLDEVTEYVKERGSKVDPQGFIDFYASKGWMIGKTPMKDWKAACRNAEHWERWNKRGPARNVSAQTGGSSIDKQELHELLHDQFK